MNAPSDRDIKKLFALSLNQCAFPNCISSIFGPSDEMIGEVCHIKARNLSGPRYDASQTDEERHSFRNLILFCRNHHKIVDNDVKRYIPEVLIQFKLDRETGGGIELTQHHAKLASRLLDSLLESMRSDSKTVINQMATGKNVTQVAGDYHHYEKPKRPKIIIMPPVGAVSPQEMRQIQDWIEKLVEKTVGMEQGRAFGMWRDRFKRRFKLTKTEQLLSLQMQDVEAWYFKQAAILTRKLKTKEPKTWRKARYSTIHMKIEQMGLEKLAYYQKISQRLNINPPFSSLTKLTKIDLERVYTLVLRDARDS